MIDVYGYALIDNEGPLATGFDADFLDHVARTCYDGRFTAVVGMPTKDEWRRATDLAAARDADERREER